MSLSYATGLAITSLVEHVGQTIASPMFHNLSADQVSLKGPDDFVTEADLACEAAIREGLAGIAPGIPLIGEEGVHAGTASLDGAPDRYFVCDPIDGTRNFAQGKKGYCVMLAYVDAAVTRAAWIYVPEEGWMATAALGGGAHLNGSRVWRGRDAVLGPGDKLAAFGMYRGGEMRPRAERLLPGIVTTNRHAIGMDYVAALRGECQGIVQTAAGPWDVLPGQLILAEAGFVTGRFDDDAGNPLARRSWTYALPTHADVDLLVRSE